MVLRWLWRKRKEPSPDRIMERTDPPPPDRIYRTGDVVGGDWRVIRVMEGGLGVVYAVEHRETGERCVLKAPKRQSDSAVKEAFRLEAETWVRLGDHPNIVRAIGVDEFAGQLYVVAELIEGDEFGRVSLRDFLKAGARRPIAVAAMTADFCYGLNHALSKGLVAHRDIKPENLLIGAAETLRITDFGLARAMALGNPSGQTAATKLGTWLTAEGEVSGTPPYMAPEQWLGTTQDVRTDIYAFGIVMYEMFYGRRPFPGPDFSDFAIQHMGGVAQIHGGIFDPIILRCLSKNQNGRYADPSELLNDLLRICKNSGIPVRPKPTIVSRRGKELSALASGLRAVGKHQEAIETARELVRIEPEEASNWTELGRLLAEIGDDKNAIAALERSLAIDETRSDAWNNFGVLLKRQKKWEGAVHAFDRALDCDAFNTGAMLNSSEALQELGQVGKAITRLRRALEIAPDKFQIWVNLSGAYVNIGDKQNALACLQKARGLAPDRYHDQIDMGIKAATSLADEPSGAALMLSDLALGIRRLEEETKQNPRDKEAWHNLGEGYVQAGEYARARDCFAHVLDLDAANSFAICRLIELSAAIKDVEAVERWCSVLAQMKNGQIASIAFKARALAQCDKYDDAKQLILDAVRKHPDEPDILVACGDVMMFKPGSLTAMTYAASTYRRAVTLLRSGTDVARLRDIEDRLRQAKQNLAACGGGR